MIIFAIAWKDVKKIFRSIFTLVMMFAAPFLITGLLYFAFGNTGDENKQIEQVRLGVINNDGGSPDFNAGIQLVEYLQSTELQDVIEFESLNSIQSGIRRVSEKDLDIFLVLPSDFSAQIQSGNPVIELYINPAISVQQNIIKGILNEFVTATVGLSTFFQVLAISGEGPVLSNEEAGHTAEGIINKFIHNHEENNFSLTMSMLTMCAMTIFFLFFAASVTAQGLITEREEGTFQRMTVSPNRFSVLLTGKFLGVFLTVAIQAIILLTGATFLFGIKWSSIPYLILMTVATIISAAGFNIFLSSLVNNTRQFGAVSGGVLTLMGMLGGLFTTGVPNLPSFFEITNKFVPHGWAITGYRALLFPSQESLPLWLLVIVTAGFGILFLFAGTILISRKLR